ncbi:hypothetical protein E2P81_ATG03239 [Venturia nashicola]|uniref:Uncharacterized protein n=1 Tax=Venturia nashicola TaxID=86259 RepID=A0A4Z1PES7_9PEZI|nr:hypothetical protein E6O75_ATG03307 [Venturia nashicola]TLD36350.1 hypothetical protein E2P81_ATG03239 [Venturia nashicola]
MICESTLLETFGLSQRRMPLCLSRPPPFPETAQPEPGAEGRESVSKPAPGRLPTMKQGRCGVSTVNQQEARRKKWRT